jgi:ATP-dependent helicase/nuclease subunit A
VAFTRAETGLFVNCKAEKKEPKNIVTTSDLIASVLLKQEGSTNYTIDILSDGSKKVVWGELIKNKVEEEKYEKTTFSMNNYPVCTIERKIRVSSKHIFNEQDELQDSRMYGILMHQLLSKIVVVDDVENVLMQALFDGLICEKDLDKVRECLGGFINQSVAKDWFKVGLKIKNECELIVGVNQILRPDRVVLNDKKITVIDYKFGEQHIEQHNRQVMQYVAVLQEMGYEVEGYLWYPLEGNVVQVK